MEMGGPAAVFVNIADGAQRLSGHQHLTCIQPEEGIAAEVAVQREETAGFPARVRG